MGLVFLATAMLVGMVASISCDPGEGVTYENRTAQTLNVFDRADLDATLAPGEKRTFSFLVYGGARTYTAKDVAGNIVFQEAYSWDDLRKLHWHIIIGP